MISARRTKQPRSWLREGRSIRLVQFWGNGFSARREGIRRNRFGRRSPRGLTPHPVILTEREERHKGRRLRAAVSEDWIREATAGCMKQAFGGCPAGVNGKRVFSGNRTP